MSIEGARPIEHLEDDPDVRTVERAADFATLGLVREGRRRGSVPFSRIGEIGYAGFTTTVVLRGGRTQQIIYVSRGVDPAVGPSLAEGFNWTLDTPVFQDAAGVQEEPDDESRATEIGNIYSYGLEEGMSTGQLDRRYNQALSEGA